MEDECQKKNCAGIEINLGIIKGNYETCKKKPCKK